MAQPIVASALVRQTLEQGIEVGSLRRTYRVYRPQSASDGAPLWLVLHGSGGTGADMQAMHDGAFDRLAEREGIVLAYPDGIGEHWNDCRPRADYSANLQNVDDVGFLRALVHVLHAELQIDLERVTAIGISNGGQMVFRLAFEAPEPLPRTWPCLRTCRLRTTTTAVTKPRRSGCS